MLDMQTTSTPVTCITKNISEMHRQMTVVDFRHLEYPKSVASVELPAYEVTIKIALCSIGIVLSLVGNINTIRCILMKHLYSNGAYFASYSLSHRNKAGSLVNDTHNANNTSNINTLRLHTKKTSSNAYTGAPLLYPPEAVARTRSKSIHSIFSFVLHNSNNNNNNNNDMDDVENNLRKASTESKRLSANHKNKNTAMDVLVLNLATSDLLIVLCCSWVHMVNSIHQNWKMGAFFCKFNTFTQVVCLTSSIASLSVIAFERFRGIVLTSRNKLNRNAAILVILLIWAFSILAAMPIYMYRRQYERVWKNHVEIWCSDDWPRHYTLKENTECVVKIDEPLKRVYYTFISLVLFFIPILVMVVSYLFILNKLNSRSILVFLDEGSLGRSLLLKQRQKVNRLLMGLIMSFTICWTPVQIFVLFEAYKEYTVFELPAWLNWVYFLVFLLAYSNGALNPLIYRGLSIKYKKEVRRMIANYRFSCPNEQKSRRQAITNIVAL